MWNCSGSFAIIRQRQLYRPSFSGEESSLDAVIQAGREEHESRTLVELVDRSKLTEPVILIADRGYKDNMAHIEQKGWKYLFRLYHGRKRCAVSGKQDKMQPQIKHQAEMGIC